ncbi:MAG: 4Fe-4S single cluster domain-containing protein [Patescibacteria group bacterium]|nr:4Fe-4S single cluster domain-containing protein [Patescibacteria group bacterium]
MTPILNIHAFIPRSRANGPGERAVVWVQGCPRRCEGCFNPTTQPQTTKELVSVGELFARIAGVEGIDGVTFSGGEPFGQAVALAELAKKIHNDLGLSVVCYTGYIVEELRAAGKTDWDELLGQTDLLIDGPYVQSMKCAEPYRGSANQRYHFFSDRIHEEEVTGAVQTAEFTLGVDGMITETGFPDADEVFGELEQLLKA